MKTKNINKEYLQAEIDFIHKDHNLDASFITMFATDERPLNLGFKVYIIFLFKNPTSILTLSTQLDQEEPAYPAISLKIPQANWYEREIHDLFGITPCGIDLDPLVLHRDWHRGKNFPMRKDFHIDTPMPISEVPHEFSNQPHAEGMNQIAVGPIHAGIIEPGHLRFCTIGEKVLKFDAQLFYTHKGIEKMAEGKTIDEALNLAEHVCGMCSYAHSTAFCQAIETLTQNHIPIRASYIRTICLELERISSHLFDLSSICSAGGFGFGGIHAARLREIIMRVIYKITGHRFFRGLNEPGGLKKDISDALLKELLFEIKDFKTKFKDWEKLVMNNDSFLDRLEGTGALTKEQAITLGIVGPPARASGINRDIRRDFTYETYKKYMPKITTYEEGDALARTKIRIDEIYESIELLKNLIQAVPSGHILNRTPFQFSEPQTSIGIVESAKGELIHSLMITPENKIYRWHVRSASYMNWRGMVQATMANNILPDGPLVNKSFNLCYACVDR
ncbi:MAG: NADH-quinone oxidoreductase subunit C [Candidatus Melainabacteria bacterium]|nr:NADH-quinone oxidoreductase subunit C [Candidatus Melainabacteria bacterium]